MAAVSKSAGLGLVLSFGHPGVSQLFLEQTAGDS